MARARPTPRASPWGWRRGARLWTGRAGEGAEARGGATGGAGSRAGAGAAATGAAEAGAAGADAAGAAPRQRRVGSPRPGHCGHGAAEPLVRARGHRAPGATDVGAAAIGTVGALARARGHRAAGAAELGRCTSGLDLESARAARRQSRAMGGGSGGWRRSIGHRRAERRFVRSQSGRRWRLWKDGAGADSAGAPIPPSVPHDGRKRLHRSCALDWAGRRGGGKGRDRFRLPGFMGVGGIVVRPKSNRERSRLRLDRNGSDRSRAVLV